MKQLKITLAISMAIIVSFRLFCGIFVLQPTDERIKGSTIIYWRAGVDIPFVASIEKLNNSLNESTGETMYVNYAQTIRDKEIFRLKHRN